MSDSESYGFVVIQESTSTVVPPLRSGGSWAWKVEEHLYERGPFRQRFLGTRIVAQGDAISEEAARACCERFSAAAEDLERT